MSTVLGLDLSLTSPGCATVHATPDGPVGLAWTLRVRDTGTARLRMIRDTITMFLDGRPADLVVIEGYAHGRPNQAHQLGELGGVVRVALTEHGTRWTTLPPATVKKLATGKGNADKAAVLAAAIRRLGYAGSSTDEADALWLAHAGHVLLGRPLVDLPQAHLAALAAHTINPTVPVENL